MFEKDLVKEILGQVLESIDKIKRRFSSIKSVDDFINTDDGQVKLDSICM